MALLESWRSAHISNLSAVQKTKLHHNPQSASSNGPRASIYLTEQGLQAARDELHFLKSVKRQEVTERIQSAREMGSTEENTEYDSAMEEQELLDARISELENVVKSAKIIESQEKSDFIVIGSTVKVEMDGQTDEFTIVGKMEANPLKKRISNESPVGKALLGAKAGEEVEVATPVVRYKCKVLEIK